MKFMLNGKERQWTGDPERSLLSWLREEEGLISPKDGCSSQGSCGCCMIQQDEKAVLSCLLPMKKVSDTAITTTDGLEKKLQEAIVAAFTHSGGIQCGFCIPGFVMSARVLLEKNPEPTRDQINQAINRNLCRCTGYIKIVDAIQALAQSLRTGVATRAREGAGGIGTRQVKFDAADTVLGFRPFVGDMKFPGMRFGALKFSDHPRAVVARIDCSKARKMPGVLAIFTAADVPGERYQGLIVKDWPVMVAEGETTRYVGDVLAGVVAETEALARAAVAEIEVSYEVLPPITDVFEALAEGTPPIHPKGNLLAVSSVIRGGDIEQALADSAFVVQRSFSTQRIEHAFMEPECCIAMPAPLEPGLLIYSQGQGVFEDRKQIAAMLGESEKQIRVIQIQNGGAFGGKEDLTVQGHAALFAHILKVPVRVALTREESIIMHPKRHPIQMDYQVGCDKNGRLTAIRAEIIGDTGAYASVGMKVLERAVGHATSAYTVPVAWIRGRTVYTNNLPCGAMRGFGANQATFAMESCVDELCEMGGFDRWQFRYDNAIHNGDRTSTGQIIQGGAGVRATLEAVKDRFYAARYAGLACGIKNTGIGNGMPDDGRILIQIEAPDKVIVYHGWTEMGQGVHTMAIQILHEETGIDPAIIDVRVDTRTETTCGMTTASRATSLVGNAIINGARALGADLKNHSLADLVGRSYRGEWICDWTIKAGREEGREPVTHYSYSYATQLVILDEKGKIEQVVAAHDAGRIINPTLFEGQIEGSVHMGLGYAISEDLPMEGGYLKSTLLARCGVLRARQMPPVEVIGVEVADPHGPYGAKGVGEIGLVPTAGAVANALYQFDRIRRSSLPLKVRHLL